MLKFFDLFPDLRLKVYKELETPKLYEVILTTANTIGDKNKKESVIELYHELLIELFNRKDPQALDYQNRFVVSWLKSLYAGNDLSFIKNDEVKQDWILFLQKKLLNGDNLSPGFKFNVKILIHRLQASDNDVLMTMMQSVKAKLKENRIPDEDELAYVAPLLDKADLNKIFEMLSNQLKNPESDVRMGTVKAMHILGTCLPDEKIKMTAEAEVRKLQGQFMGANYTDASFYKYGLLAYAPLLSDKRLLELYNQMLIIYNLPEDLNEGVAFSVLIQLIPYLPKNTQADQAKRFLRQFQNNSLKFHSDEAELLLSFLPNVERDTFEDIRRLVLAKLVSDDELESTTAIKVLPAFASGSTQAEVDSWVQSLVVNLSNEAIAGVTLDTLRRLAPYMSPTTATTLVLPRVEKFKTRNLYIAKAARRTFYEVLRTMPQDKIESMIPALIEDLKNDEYTQLTLEMMIPLIPLISKQELEKLQPVLLEIIKLKNFGTTERGISCLGEMIPYVSPEKSREIIDKLTSLLTSSDFGEERSAMLALIDKIPKIPNDRDRILPLLIKKLETTVVDWVLKTKFIDVLPSLSSEQLKSIVEIKKSDNFYLQDLKFQAQFTLENKNMEPEASITAMSKPQV